MQKQFIKDEIVKMERQFKDEFGRLKYNIQVWNLGKDDHISQRSLVVASNSKLDLMSNKNGGQGIAYLPKQMPFDNVNGYSGMQEYDENYYLTKL